MAEAAAIEVKPSKCKSCCTKFCDKTKQFFGWVREKLTPSKSEIIIYLHQGIDKGEEVAEKKDWCPSVPQDEEKKCIEVIGSCLKSVVAAVVNCCLPDKTKEAQKDANSVKVNDKATDKKPEEMFEQKESANNYETPLLATASPEEGAIDGTHG